MRERYGTDSLRCNLDDDGASGETTVTKAEWSKYTKPSAMLEAIHGKLSDRKLRLFSCACLRRVCEKLPVGSFRQTIEETERAAEETAGESHEAGPWWLRLHTDPVWASLLIGEVDVYGGVKSILVLAAQTHAKAPEASWLNAYTAADPIWRSDVAQKWLTAGSKEEESAQSSLLRDVAGIPSRRICLEPALLKWNDGVVAKLALSAYEQRIMPEGTLDNNLLAILADALEEAGCTDADILGHLRGPGPHVRGCWPVDLILSKDR
jgi:hypothetical protein